MDAETSDNDDIEEVYAIELVLAHGRAPMRVFTLVLYYEAAANDENRPLTSDGKIVFFTRQESLPTGFDIGDDAFKRHRRAQVSVAYRYDVAGLLEYLERGGRFDQSAATHVNELLDLVRATGRRMRRQDVQYLHQLADHATFDSTLDGFFSDEKLRSGCINAVLWSIGAILTSSIVLDR